MVTSAGILLYRHTAAGELEVLVAHMGGPFWAAKDERAWSIPKGEYDADEEPWAAARREFAEETGTDLPDGPRLDLGHVRQSSGKVVTAFAVKGDLDPDAARSNTFDLEWPPRSGRTQAFPEVDRVAWVSPQDARRRLVASQSELVDRLEGLLDGG